MEKIPTAEEFLKLNNIKAYPIDIQMMVEFAKMHVEAALESASEKVGLSYKQSILNSYPLTNIK